RFVGALGYYRDSAQRSYVRARELDAGRGRWLTPDPIGFAGGLNVYGYAEGNPATGVDPLGLAKITVYFSPIWVGPIQSPWWHAYLVVCDNNGKNPFVFTGGPEVPADGLGKLGLQYFGLVKLDRGRYLPVEARDYPTKEDNIRRSRLVLQDDKPAQYYIDML